MSSILWKLKDFLERVAHVDTEALRPELENHARERIESEFADIGLKWLETKENQRIHEVRGGDITGRSLFFGIPGSSSKLEFKVSFSEGSYFFSVLLSGWDDCEVFRAFQGFARSDFGVARL